MDQTTDEHTLAQWPARETALREPDPPIGLGKPEQFAGRTGLQRFEALLPGQVPRAPISQTLDFMLVEASTGHAEFQGRPQFAHYNPQGGVVGGWMATLPDSVAGCAVRSQLSRGKAHTTLELKANFVKALTDRVPLVRAAGDIAQFGTRSQPLRCGGSDRMAHCLLTPRQTA